MRAVLRRQAGALVAHREREHVALLPSANPDARARRRIFDGVGQDLAQGLLDQDGVDLNERHPVRQLDVDRTRPAGSATALQRRIDHIGHLGPFELRVQRFAADAGGVEQVLDFVVETFRFVVHHVGERHEARVAGDRGRVAQHGRRPQDRRDQGVAEALRLRPHPHLGEGVREPELLQRRRRVVQHRLDAGANLLLRLGRLLPEIDGDHAEIGSLARHGAHQPEIPLMVRDRGSGRGAAGEDRGHGGADVLRDIAFADRLRLAIGRTARLEQRDLAPDDGRQMLLDRIENFRGRVPRRQPARKGVKVVDLFFAFPDDLRFAAHAHREMARHHGDDREDRQAEPAGGILDVNRMQRPVEEKRRADGAGEGRDHRGTGMR